MKRLTLLLCLMLALPLLIQAEEERGFIKIKDKAGKDVCLYENSYALIIGVSKYTNGWPDLPGVKKDVPRVEEALKKQGFKVFVIENPTYDQMEQEFKSFINKYGRKPDDRLLFYLSGHGHTIKLADGREMGYIVPADAENPNIDPNGFFDKAMDMQQIEVYAKRIQSKHALFMFDSCFSGSIFDIGRAVPDNISYKTAKPVRQIITAGAADETVPDNSIFCRQFIEGLNGEADTDKDGYITGVELGEFLQKTVINYSKKAQNPQYGKIKDPDLDKGDFVFQMPKTEPPPIPTPPSGSAFSLDDLKNEADRQSAIEKVNKAWADNLDEMIKAYEVIKEFEKGSGTADLKTIAWERFLSSYGENNPNSQEDDTIRQEASNRLDYWKNQKPQPLPIKPSVTTTVTEKDDMVLIPAGEFQMGSNESDDEKPIHTVYLDAFYIDKYEVTNAQYKKFMDAKGYKAPGYWNDPKYNAPNHPVVGVTWNDAKAYADWAGKRLPTEAEWEKAARGGVTGKKYVWGDEWPPPNKAGNFDNSITKDGYTYTAPVGSFKPNGYGLYDMAGNVWEWCADWYDNNYYFTSTKSNPAGPSSGTYHVCRGGSWYYYAPLRTTCVLLTATTTLPLTTTLMLAFVVFVVSLSRFPSVLCVYVFMDL